MHSINKLLTVVIITLGLSISASISSPISIDNYDEEIKLVMERYDYTFILKMVPLMLMISHSTPV